jgi:hypothetical protein
MLNRRIAVLLLLTFGCGVSAQAKPLASGAASPRQRGILEELTSYGASLLLALKDDGYPWCGHAYCPTPPTPPPPGHTMSSITKPHASGKGSLP